VPVAAAQTQQIMFGKLKQRLAGAGPSHHQPHPPSRSKADPRSSLKGVGQTERLVSRSVRIQNKNKQSKKQQQPPSSQKKLPSPQLNGSGHLTTEEVVRRTSSSVVTKELLLGSPKDPIHLEVCM